MKNRYLEIMCCEIAIGEQVCKTMKSKLVAEELNTVILSQSAQIANVLFVSLEGVYIAG